VTVQYTDYERSPLVTCVVNSYPERVTIPEAVVIDFDLLKMSTIVLETCRGI